MVIFDLDGTLIDPTEGILASYRHVSRVLRVALPDCERIRDQIGPPIRDAVRSLFRLPDSEIEVAVAAFRDYYGRQGVQQFVPYEGVSAVLKRLVRDGFSLRIATSKLTRHASEIVGLAGWSDHFDKICGSSDDHTATKSEIVRHALDGLETVDSLAVLVGDRGEDLFASRENDLPFVGVSWGFSSNRRLEDQGAQLVASTPEDLESMIRKLSSNSTAGGQLR